MAQFGNCFLGGSADRLLKRHAFQVEAWRPHGCEPAVVAREGALLHVALGDFRALLMESARAAAAAQHRDDQRGSRPRAAK
eukprot:scaffold33250_cov65-Phaeocystis_antarctica.AAC.1